MIRNLAFAVVSVSLALSAAAQDKGYSALAAKAKARIVRDFKDPESARFRNLGIYLSTTGKGGPLVCGEVNAKNSYGAYVGYRGFVVDEDLAYVEEEGDGGSNYAFYGPILCHRRIASVK